MKYNKTYFGIILLGIFGLFACNTQTDDTQIIAKVYDKVLSLDEFQRSIPHGMSPEDSVLFARNYIDNWIKDQAIVHTAERNLLESDMQIEDQVQEYRNTLLSYTYKKRYVEQYLDTIVLPDEIKNFYEENKKEFELKDNIVKVIFIKLPIESENTKMVRKMMKKYKPEESIALADIAKRDALNYFLDDSVWLYFDELLKVVPIQTYNQENYLKNNTYIELRDSVSITCARILGFKIKNGVSPLSFELDRIRKLIINRRKQELISDLENNIYQQALKEGSININDNQ